MKDIKHFDAASIADAVTRLASPRTAPMAGGTDLITVMRAMLYPGTPDAVVNLKTIPDLDYIREESGNLKIGALATLDAIAKSPVVQAKYTALAEAARMVGSPQIRNMGTIAGNICQETRCWYFRAEHNQFNCLKKNPQGSCYAIAGDNRYHSIFGAINGCVCVNPGDLAPALMALGAVVFTNKRRIAIADFFDVKVASHQSAMTVLEPAEIVIEIEILSPLPGTKSAFMKFAMRKSIDFPIVNCAAVIGDGKASICLNAVSGKPRRATEAEEAIAGKEINDANAGAAATAALQDSVALSRNSYIIQIARTMVKRAILACK